jgi:hypothetical protein
MHVTASDWCHDHVESALIGYVCIGLYEPVGGNGYVFKELSLLVFVCLVIVYSLAPVVYTHTCYFVVTLSFICGLIPP